MQSLRLTVHVFIFDQSQFFIYSFMIGIKRSKPDIFSYAEEDIMKRRKEFREKNGNLIETREKSDRNVVNIVCKEACTCEKWAFC